MDRRPSALLQPPGLQVQTRGPGFLASPIRVTGCQWGRSSQAQERGVQLLPIIAEPGELPVRPVLKLEMTWAHRHKSM
eukprot:1552843-Amphidinium_carterae.2